MRTMRQISRLFDCARQSRRERGNKKKTFHERTVLKTIKKKILSHCTPGTRAGRDSTATTGVRWSWFFFFPPQHNESMKIHLSILITANYSATGPRHWNRVVFFFFLLSANSNSVSRKIPAKKNVRNRRKKLRIARVFELFHFY